MFNPLTGENMKKLIALIALIGISGIALAGHHGGFGRSYRGGGEFRDGGYRGGRGGYYLGAFGRPGIYAEPYSYGSEYEEYEPYGAVGVTGDIAEGGLETAEDITEDTARTVRSILPY